MPSSINSTSSSPGGLISSGDTDNELEIKTGDTTAISIDASQNVTVAGDLTVNGTFIGGGDVVGPESSTDNAIALFDGTTGKIIKDGVVYTNANTASTVVQRDASGNFSAGTITAALTGAATSAATWTTGITITIGPTGKSVNGSANVTWTTAEIGINTTNVLSATAGASVGAVGTYAYLGDTVSTTYSEGATVAGSQLRWVGLSGSTTWSANATISTGQRGSTTAASGTWMYVSRQTVISQFSAGVWLRIS